MKIKFTNVGRNKATWQSECDYLTYEWLYSQVKPYLLSTNITFDGGIIFAGFHQVGNYEIVAE